ncbi:MAG: hypothetical protein OSA23_11505 [Rhodospirillales bacterium]|nr:hypothetical protein [Rhodospirillales bacterium]
MVFFDIKGFQPLDEYKETMISFNEFSELHHAITLLGMSGVGKTMLSKELRKSANWFHYSADYRIGTRYLAEDIVDNIKYKVMQMDDPFVADLLKSDSIYIQHNISVDNLDPVITFLGMYGDAAQGGLNKAIFLERQELYRDAEARSMKELDRFIRKSWDIYGCQQFINDASGSLCEICDPDDENDSVLTALQDETLILYIQSDAQTERDLMARAKSSPKPLFYHPSFITPMLADKPDNGAGIGPLDFARPLFPDLLEFRKPRYAAIAKRLGFTIGVSDLFVTETPNTTTPDADRFMRNIYDAITAQATISDAAAKNLDAYVATCKTRAQERNKD